MAQRTFIDLPELSATPANGDILALVDVSDTSESDDGTSKKITRANLVGGLATSASVTVVADDLTTHEADTSTHGVSGAIVGTTDTQTLTNKTLTSPKIGTAIADTNGNEVIKTPATASAVNEITATNAATGTAPGLSSTGDDTNIDFELNPKGTGVFKAKTTVELEVVPATTNTSTGDGKRFFRIPKELDGFNLVDVADVVYTAGTTGTTDVQIRNKTQAVDMLSTKLTIDSGETDSATAATAAVIDATNDDVAWKDVIVIDVDAVSTTPAQGLVVAMTFAKP